ncbi:MAG: hypothetical protein KKG99_15325 [Bacteroidetes bacterium]|nr:hypothetical protein [Bacteroidota bacterium]
MKKNLIILSVVIFSSFMLLTSCKKDEVLPDAPIVNAPATAIDVDANQTVAVTFNVIVPGGFSSASVSALNGTVAISTKPEVNATTGNVIVSFTAGNTAGAASVTLTVTDKNQKTDDATAVLSVAEEQMIITVTSNITANTIWESGKVYILASRIAVIDGATLTIQEGVVVKGQAGTGANATALVVARGGKLMANGTAQKPIIFTSVADEIMPGQVASPNLDPQLSGLWGGLIVLGKARISGSAEAIQIEGIPPSDQNGLYGGTNDADNSGVIKYISIRHGGANIGEGNEINGLTLGGVGSGTIIENVEVIANQDDGIEWFGGTVSVKNAVVWNSGDDAFDTDQSWAGTLDNFVGISGSATDHALEIDGPEGSYLAAHTLKNGTIKGHPATELGDFRDGARGTFSNIYFFGFPNPADAGRGDLSLSGDKTLTSFAEGNLVFSNLQVTLPAGVALNTVFRNGTDVHATSVALGANTVGADLTKFTGWSWAAVSGALNF